MTASNCLFHIKICSSSVIKERITNVILTQQSITMDFTAGTAATTSDGDIDDCIEGPDNIWIASSNGDISRVQQLLTEGINVNGQDDTGYSPM